MKNSDFRIPISGRAPGDRRHNGDVITVFKGSRLFLQVADVLVVDVEIDESPKLSVIGVEVFAQVGMLRHQGIHGFADGRSRDVDRSLFAYVLA